MVRLAVVLPAWNEAANIASVVSGVRRLEIPGVQITPVVVDDGSTDDTSALARRSGAEVISHPRNRGVGAAFRTGLEWALRERCEALVHMDSDGQVPAAEIPLLYEPIARDRADLALGCRFLGPPPEHLAPWKATALKSVARVVGVLTGYRLHDLSCGFRCMNRRVMEAIHPTFDYDYIQETLIQALAARARVLEVPVHIRYEQQPARPGLSANSLRYGRRFMGLLGYSLASFYGARAAQRLNVRL